MNELIESLQKFRSKDVLVHTYESYLILKFLAAAPKIVLNDIYERE